MKNKILTFLGLATSLCAFSASDDPVLMKIDGQNIYKSEFEYIYHKNNSTSTVEKKSLDEYVDLFVNYKLKVREAKNIGLDLDPSYNNEYDDYERQLSVPYMRDENMEKALLEEAFERSKYKLLASHILVKIDENTDSVAAWNTINKAYKELKDGANFSDMAMKYSDCPSKASGGSLGYFTAFDMVYEFENEAYATPVGSFSEPFRTRFGYHIVKVFDKKENIQDRRAAHILIKSEVPNYLEKGDSIYNLLKNGAKFEKMVQKYSMDPSTVNKGGDLGFMKGSAYPAQIIGAVGSLNTIGDYKKVATAFGIHILKLTDKKTYKSIDECLPELKEKLSKSDRSGKIDESYRESLMNKYDVVVYEDALSAFVPLVMEENNTTLASAYRKLNEPLFTFGGNVYAQDAFLTDFKNELVSYHRAIRNKNVNLKKKELGQLTPEEFVQSTFDDFMTRKLYQAEREAVVEQNSDLKNLLQEYSDGLLLFEISSKRVWNKASSDTAGLKKYYEEHKDNYKWDAPKYKGWIVRCKTEESQQKAETILKTNGLEDVESELRTLGSDVKIQQGVYAKGVNAVVDEKIFNEAKKEDKEYPYSALRGVVISQPQEYTDVKGVVTADYQNYLEAEWIKSLREKYTVEINKDVLKTVK